MSMIFKPSSDEFLLYNGGIILNPEELNNTVHDIFFESNSRLQRGKATYIENAGLSLVLKHYYRGGIVARFSRDKYLWTGLRQTRAFKEFHLLEAMKVLSLPVPVPIAARIKHQGLSYSADLITQRIVNSTALGELLKYDEVDISVWNAIGQMIRLFHWHGVYHADLNANNILVAESQQLYLIDFDKSYFRMKKESWMQQMLERLKRSLDKFKNNSNDYHFSDENWTNLMAGYTGPQPELSSLQG